MINKDTISLIGNKERNVLVGLLGAGTTIGVPDVNALSILYKRSETLAGTINQFANR